MLGEASSDQRSSCILLTVLTCASCPTLCQHQGARRYFNHLGPSPLEVTCLLFDCLLSICQTVTKPFSFTTRDRPNTLIFHTTYCSKPTWSVPTQCLLLQFRTLPQGLIPHFSLLLHLPRSTVLKAQSRLSAWALRWTPFRLDLNSQPWCRRKPPRQNLQTQNPIWVKLDCDTDRWRSFFSRVGKVPIVGFGGATRTANTPAPGHHLQAAVY